MDKNPNRPRERAAKRRLMRILKPPYLFSDGKTVLFVGYQIPLRSQLRILLQRATRWLRAAEDQ